MSNSARCTGCQGFIEHSFITANGIDVYRCTRENEWNDKGRYFIQTGQGLVEVTPVAKHHKKGADYYYEIVDKERRRKLEEQQAIDRELETRRRIWQESANKFVMRYKRPDEDEDAE